MLDGSGDEELLSLAAGEGRIFITFDVHDFPVIARRFAEAGRSHAGLAIVVGIDHSEFATFLEVIDGALTARPRPADWIGLTAFVCRAA